MANNNPSNDPWVDDRLNALEPPSGWRPDSAAALGKMRAHDHAYRKRRARWLGSAMAASVMLAAVLLTPAKCAFGVCRTPAVLVALPAASVLPSPAPVPQPAVTVVQPTPQPAAAIPHATKPAPAPAAAAPEIRNFKESGDPNAPITCELFTDYQCPHCATVYDQIVPMLLAEYVQSGKMKFVHRDFPLPMHAYARLAARYANAAGTLGEYDLVVNQIFRTQAIWDRTGDVDSQVAQVLPTGVVDRVRDLVRNDGHLDDTVLSDLDLGRSANLNQTPTLVITYKGKRQLLAPIPPYGLLKSYLDELLTR